MSSQSNLIRWFEDLSIGDVPVVGGKNASLGEMFRSLHEVGVAVPDGFATTSDAFRSFLRDNGIDEKIATIVGQRDHDDVEDLTTRARQIRSMILAAELP